MPSVFEQHTVKTPLFSTACTTCHARIVVLREEAIGSILGCPKCGGMVQITPPDGWAESHATELAALGKAASLPRSGPPPITKVSQTYLTLDLEPEQKIPRWQVLIQSKIAWAWMATSVCVIGILIWAFSGSATQADIAKNEPAPPKKAEKTLPKPKIDTPEPIAPETPKPVEEKVADLPTPPAESKEPMNAATPPAFKPLDASAETPAAPMKEEPANDTTLPQIADGDATQTATPSAANIPHEPELKLPPLEKPLPLPINASKLVKQIPQPDIDLGSRLDEVVPSFSLKSVPFKRAMEIVSSMSGVPVTLDADALRLVGASSNDPISIDLKNSTVETLFEEIASRRGLGVEVEKGHVRVTAIGEKTDVLQSVSYQVADLCENGMTADDLAGLLQNFVSPDAWRKNGGDGTITIENDTLQISQTELIQREIVLFCDKIRIARGISPQGRHESGLTTATAYVQAKSALDKTITANFHEPTAIGEVLEGFGERAGVEILLDRRELDAAGLSEKTEISYTVEKQSLESALDGLLRPLGLGFRAIDAHTLQVAPQKELDGLREWEIYSIDKMLNTEFTAQDLILQIKHSVAPSSWTVRGRIYYDAPSKSLIVSQTPTVQAALSRYLAEQK
jgi:hypothetical protein